jgi:hypothetical protein
MDIADGVTGGRGLGLALGALLLGAGIGGGLGYIFTKRRLKTKYEELVDAEIAEMREHYLAKGKALEASIGKGDLEQITRERGYGQIEPDVSAAPPMAVKPPASVQEQADAVPDDSAMAENAVEGPSGVKIPPIQRNVFRDRENRRAQREQEIPPWNWTTERESRSNDRPYVIHYDERHESEGYSDATLTYYLADDIVCNERDEVMDLTEREQLLGEANLDRFGHGSNDPDIVFIRNDTLELVYEVIRSENSYSEEVHGLKHHSWDRGNLERMRQRERHAQED